MDVPKVPIRLFKSFEFLVDHIALDVPMPLVIRDNVLQATEELQQQTAAALATVTLSLRRGPRLAWQAQATPRAEVISRFGGVRHQKDESSKSGTPRTCCCSWLV